MSADKSAIDEVTAAFFDSFTTLGRAVPGVDVLYRLFLPEAVIVNNCGDVPAIYDVAGFVEPRRTLLAGGSIADFREEETSEKTEIAGNVAQRISTYRKSWRASGEALEGRGVKALQFVRTPDGWKIASLAWDDERPGFSVG